MKAKQINKIQPDWWSKTFAGLCLGLAIALAAGVLVSLLMMQSHPVLAPQLGMWTIPWVWCPLFFIAYFIPKGWQAIVLYGVICIIAYSSIFLLRA